MADLTPRAPLDALDPRDFALWMHGTGGVRPDVEGRWYRYDSGENRFVTLFEPEAPEQWKRRHADISIYPSGRWRVTISHGPDQIFRVGEEVDCVVALREGLRIRDRWLAGEPCGNPACRYRSCCEPLVEVRCA